jgi:hypothetical protein
MKKNKNIFILFIMLIFGCSKKSPELIITKWAQKNEELKNLERSVANNPEVKSLKTIFNIETLKKQILEKEKKFKSVEKVQGRWKHLDLSLLPVPQANFLLEYGHEIGDLANPERINYSSCRDVPCVFNKIYSKENHVAGYVHYLWYLTFGHMLSADNKVPSQILPRPGIFNGRGFPLESYLYTDKELYGLWRLSLMLKSPHTTLNHLKEFQRIPRGELFEDQKWKWACGLAHSIGWIILADSCLSTDENPDFGFLYTGVIHELSHHVDFEEGRRLNLSNRSLKQDYLNVSGMSLTEFVDSSKKIKREWGFKGIRKVVSSYAETSPIENFAESLAFFRVQADHTKNNLSPEHFSFVSENYYQNRSFENHLLMKKWISDYSLEFERFVLKSVGDCTKTNSKYVSNFFTPTDFTLLLSSEMVNCLGKYGEDALGALHLKTSLYEPEGRLILDRTELKSSFDGLIKKNLLAKMETHLNEWLKDKNYLTIIPNLEKIFFDRTHSFNAFINCQNDVDEMACYKIEITDSFIQNLNLIPLKFQGNISKKYLELHTFEKVKTEIDEVYHQFTSIHHSLISNKVKKLWEACKSIPHDDSQPPTGSFFQISDGYMISSFYNCLNARIAYSSKEVIDAFAFDDLKVIHPVEEKILSSEVIPKMVKIVKDFYLSERINEKKIVEDFIFKNQHNIRNEILSDLSWIKLLPLNDYLEKACREKAFALIPLTPLYHLKSEIFEKFVDTYACKNLEGTPQFQQWFPLAKNQFLKDLNNQIEKKLVDIALKRLKACVREYPSPSDSSDKPRLTAKRKSCLVDNWFELEERVLVGIEKDPSVVLLKVPVSLLKSNLMDKRELIQKYMLDNFFN